MPVRVLVTDLQSRVVYRGELVEAEIRQGKDVLVNLENYPGRIMRIPRVRGWVVSDSHVLYYLMDEYGRRFRMRILPSVIDAKQ